jgi:hypothetical protein
MHSYPENWMEVRVQLTVSTEQKRGWDSELKWTERKVAYHSPSIAWPTVYSAYLNFAYCRLWKYKTEKCGVRMRFRDNPPTVSNVVTRGRSRGLRVNYKGGHTFTFPYKINKSKASINIVRSSQTPLLLNGAASLTAQLIRQAYCCIISHGHTLCCTTICLLALSMHSSLILPLHTVSICLLVIVVDFLFSRSGLPV